MKLKFKYQQFQADAAKAIVDVFAGQPKMTHSYMIDPGSGYYQRKIKEDGNVTSDDDFTGWRNHPVEVDDHIVLAHIRKIQQASQLAPSDKLEGRANGYNLTVEMETGVGKTYTYIKTMYELNQAYGWCKFIVVVPSVAIREGVYKSFQMTQAHFAEEYGTKIRFFIYNSAKLAEIDSFATDSAINVMIINSQAFNKDVNKIGKKTKTGKDQTPIIFKKMDTFRSRRPIDVIAKTNPIMIIDEPQSVEGPQTKKNLKRFNPLFTLRYSATHKADSIYNMIYRLDAMEAYNKRLVKKIAVKGFTETGTTATESYVYLEKINLSKKAPTATLHFEVKQGRGVKAKSRVVREKDDLFALSNELEEYKAGFVVSRIDGRDNSIEFLNGIKLDVGDVIGKMNVDQLRRVQIRETIESHIEREHQLFNKGIKVLSLFFIDEVANYREYDEAGQPLPGKYAKMFEEEYADITGHLQREFYDDAYIKYLKAITAEETHAGYFSIDKKGKMINSKAKGKEKTSDDVDAYDLIMKNKELLLDRDPGRSPVRFIFSHSALREGWDNPNVFQICTLKQSASDIKRRQEIGRGLRLCVNQNGERMDESALGMDVHNVNVLTIIASESYDSFAEGLQHELAEELADRPKQVTADLFIDKIIHDDEGNERVIEKATATHIYHSLIRNEYIDENENLTDHYYQDRANGQIKMPDQVASYADDIIKIIDSVYQPNSMRPTNARDNNVTLRINQEQYKMKEFHELWSRINAKSVYHVSFDAKQLIDNSVTALNSERFHVSKAYFTVESGVMEEMKSKKDLLAGESFTRGESWHTAMKISASNRVRYDLIGKIVEATGLTRKDVAAILSRMHPVTFNLFKVNPEEFIIKVSQIINEQKAKQVIEHITYDILNERYTSKIFENGENRKGKLGDNAMAADKHLYNYVIFDSKIEEKFAKELEIARNVAVYVKLPNDFYIPTPVGHYNPDWAIAFYEGEVKHIYFVAETKGSPNPMDRREIENAKIECAKKHFKAISGDDVVYDVVDSYKMLFDIVNR